MRNKMVLWVYLCTSGKQKHTKSKTEQPQLKCSLNLYMLGLYLILGLQLNKIDRILLSEDPPNSGKKHDIHIIKINKHCCVKVGDTGTELMGSEKWEWRGEKDFPEAETQISRLIKADTDGAMFISCGSIPVEYYLWMIKKKKKNPPQGWGISARAMTGNRACVLFLPLLASPVLVRLTQPKGALSRELPKQGFWIATILTSIKEKAVALSGLSS